MKLRTLECNSALDGYRISDLRFKGRVMEARSGPKRERRLNEIGGQSRLYRLARRLRAGIRDLNPDELAETLSPAWVAGIK